MDVAFLVLLILAVALQGATAILFAILLKNLGEAVAAAKKEVADLKKTALTLLANYGLTL